MLKASSWSLRTKSIPTLTSHCKEQTKNVRESSWQTINHCIPLSLVAFLHVTDSECHRLALHSLCISPVISSLMIRFYASTETVQLSLLLVYLSFHVRELKNKAINNFFLKSAIGGACLVHWLNSYLGGQHSVLQCWLEIWLPYFWLNFFCYKDLFILGSQI